ncbi:MAG: V-type ATP synthase subunit D [Clostridiales bacterium]|nr:MAG: V-type ATP synthase subunit D [Clostridiales bacterium]
MSAAVFPTKGNLILLKKSLALASVGFDLIDKKRNILIREIMTMIDEARALQGEINSTFEEAYRALQEANVDLGSIENTVRAVPWDDCITVLNKSVMGVEIPTVRYHPEAPMPYYGFVSATETLDHAFAKFRDAKELCVRLAEVENGVMRLARSISKTQKRANALKNIVIPDYEEKIRFITDYLEEKEREEFIRMKVLKKQKEKASFSSPK